MTDLRRFLVSTCVVLPVATAAAQERTAETGPLEVAVTDDGAMQIRGSMNGQVLWVNGQFSRRTLGKTQSLPLVFSGPTA